MRKKAPRTSRKPTTQQSAKPASVEKITSATTHRSLRSSLLTLLSNYWLPILFIIAGIFLRFYNYQHSLYFIYDQGRDAWVLERMAHGKLSLIGPTSGLPGFFIGPFWYYVGMMGYFLGAGNPYVICLWLISVACIALPLYWVFAHKLFPGDDNQKFSPWAILTAILLATVPGSFHASNFIWNPLLSVPLMLGSFLCFLKAHQSRGFLFLAFLLLALTLQSEFAYGVFFIVPLLIAIPWVRQKFDLLDFATAVVAGGLTAIPQAVFDLRHQFLMTKSLLGAMTDKSQSISWATHLAQRPAQLLQVSLDLLLSTASRPSWLGWIVVGLFLLGALLVLTGLRSASALSQTPSESDGKFRWKLLLLFALIPYPFFLLWRGNHGYFFDYYLTCHYVFLIPIIVLAAKKLLRWSQRFWLSHQLVRVGLLIVLYLSTRYSLAHWQNSIGSPDNQAGLYMMEKAVENVYLRQSTSLPDTPQPVVQIYTPNVYTEQYDYLFHWYARVHHLPEPRTLRTPTDPNWFVFIENKAAANPTFFQPWYYEATKSGQLKRAEQVGVLTIEEWQK
jgi:hypothetical protein